MMRARSRGRGCRGSPHVFFFPRDPGGLAEAGGSAREVWEMHPGIYLVHISFFDGAVGGWVPWGWNGKAGNSKGPGGTKIGATISFFLLSASRSAHMLLLVCHAFLSDAATSCPCRVFGGMSLRSQGHPKMGRRERGPEVEAGGAEGRLVFTGATESRIEYLSHTS